MIDLKDTYQEAIESMYFAYREFTSKPDEILEKRGLNRAHHRILYFVGKNPGISVGALTELLNISKQAINAPLRQLTEMNFISNNVNQTDRRSKLLHLTAKGLELEKQLSGSQLELLSGVFANKPEVLLHQWLSVMHEIAKKDKSN